MSKIKTLIAIGGTGGHVLPGYNLAKDLIGSNYNVELVTDKRGHKYLNKIDNLKISIMPSSPLVNRNIFTKFLSLIIIIYSIIRSLIFLIFNRPKIIFGMGGYGGRAILIDMENSRIVVLNSLHYNRERFKYSHTKLLLDPIKNGK